MTKGARLAETGAEKVVLGVFWADEGNLASLLLGKSNAVLESIQSRRTCPSSPLLRLGARAALACPLSVHEATTTNPTRLRASSDGKSRR